MEHVQKVRRTLSQIGISPGHVQTFFPDGQSDLTQKMDKFVEQMVGSYLDSVLKQEVKK